MHDDVGDADETGETLDAGGDVPVVHLAVAHAQNRQLLADALADTYDVRTDGSVAEAPFDACIVDRRTAEHSLDTLRERRETTDLALPVLLLADAAAADRLPAAAWDVVDDVVDLPVRQRVLERRLANLVDRRRLTVDLDRRRRRSEERFRSLFRSAPDPIVVTTPDGDVTAVNDAFRETFDVDDSDVVGRPLAALDYAPVDHADPVLSPDDDPSETSRELLEWKTDTPPSAESAESDTPPSAEPGESDTPPSAEPGESDTPPSVEPGESAHPRLVTELHTATVTDRGTVRERVGVFRDLTALVRQNERLRDFAGMVAHDLRNPLTVARGHLDLARTDDPTALDPVDAALDRMERLLDEVVTLAHHGQTVIEPDPLDLATIAADAWSHVDTADATLDLDADHIILADRSRLTELLENLYRNAVEHSSTCSHSQAREDSVERGSGPTVRVGLLPDDAGFFVADDGPGIPEAERDDVFETGFTTADDGTGFGLSIVRQIVDAHGWTVAITESEAGGARFEFAGVETE